MRIYFLRRRRLLALATGTVIFILLLSAAVLTLQGQNQWRQQNQIVLPELQLVEEEPSLQVLEISPAKTADIAVDFSENSKDIKKLPDSQQLLEPPDNKDDDDDDEDDEEEDEGFAAEDTLKDEIYEEDDEDNNIEDDEEEDNDNPVFREGDFDELPAVVTAGTKGVPNKNNSENLHTPHQTNRTNVSTSVYNFVQVLTKRPNDIDVSGKWEPRRLQAKRETVPLINLKLVAISYKKKIRNNSNNNINNSQSVSQLVKKASSQQNNRSARKGAKRVVWFPNNVTLISASGFPIIEDGIFWSRKLEDITPKGQSDEEVKQFADGVRKLSVVKMEPPSWLKCGRPKNQFLTMCDGSYMCARYRHPYNYLILGEVMSFYLARLLDIKNVPVVVLSKINDTSHMWGSSNLSFTKAEWLSNTTVALIQWINDLERDKMPLALLKMLQSGGHFSTYSSQLKSMSKLQLVELLQWSDLIVFDYITGNYDRVASMQDAAEKEKRPSIMQETIHNLVKSHKTKGLWLIDNESGLIDAYTLLNSGQDDRFYDFHRQMLSTMCIFRRSLWNNLNLLMAENVHTVLVNLLKRSEPVLEELPTSEIEHPKFIQTLNDRVSDVHRWISACANKYRGVG